MINGLVNVSGQLLLTCTIIEWEGEHLNGSRSLLLPSDPEIRPFSVLLHHLKKPFLKLFQFI